MTSPLFGIYGAGGCARGIMPLARELLQGKADTSEDLVFIDDAPSRPSHINKQRVLSYREFCQHSAKVKFAAIAIANGTIRARLAQSLHVDGIKSWTIKASNMVLMDAIELGEGALLSPFVTLTSNIRIGRHFHANLYSYVEHDCVIGDFVTFAPAVKCNGNIVIEDFAYIGTGAIIRQGEPGKPLVIGRGAVVGMGAVVTKDVPASTTVVGNPARPLVQSGSI